MLVIPKSRPPTAGLSAPQAGAWDPTRQVEGNEVVMRDLLSCPDVQLPAPSLSVCVGKMGFALQLAADLEAHVDVPNWGDRAPSGRVNHADPMVRTFAKTFVLQPIGGPQPRKQDGPALALVLHNQHAQVPLGGATEDPPVVHATALLRGAMWTI